MPELLDQAGVSPQRSPDFTKQSIEQWCALCANFLQWEREHILQSEASPTDRNEHRQALKWLLRLTRTIHASVADPEFPDRSTLALLEIKLWQLDQSWKMIYEPISEEEANRILAEVCPDEP